MRMVKSPSGITFHWRCEVPNCAYESEEIVLDKNSPNPEAPKKCPDCGRVFPPGEPGSYIHVDPAAIVRGPDEED